MLTKISNRNVRVFNSFVSLSFSFLLIFDGGFASYNIIITVEPPLTDTSIQRTPPNNGQIFSSQNTLWQKVKPPYSGHLSTTDDKIGPIGVRYMEVPLYYQIYRFQIGYQSNTPKIPYL